MATLSISRRVQALRRGRGPQGHRPRGHDGGVRRARRTVGVRQVHASRDDRRARERQPGRNPHRRKPGQFRRAQRPRHRHGVPVLRALSDDDRPAEHHLRHGKPARSEGRAGCGGQARLGAVADRAAVEPQARTIVRRAAAAGGDGPGAGARPQAFPVRRAALQSRRQAARRHAHRNQEAASTRWQDDRLCHA